MKAGGNWQVLVGAMVLAVGSGAATAGIGDYIEAVQAEVDEFATGQFKLRKDSPWRGIVESEKSGPETLSGPAGLEQFDRFLKETMPGTYIMYVRLPVWKKEQIYRDYVDTGDIDKTRDHIYKARASMGRR